MISKDGIPEITVVADKPAKKKPSPLLKAFYKSRSPLADKTCAPQYRYGEEQLAISLRYFSTGESLSSLMFRYRVSKPCICLMIPRVCFAIVECLMHTWMPFPTSSADWLKHCHQPNTTTKHCHQPNTTTNQTLFCLVYIFSTAFLLINMS